MERGGSRKMYKPFSIGILYSHLQSIKKDKNNPLPCGSVPYIKDFVVKLISFGKN